MSSALVRLTVPAAAATAGAPVGPALGQRGVKAIDFVRQFNERTAPLYAKDVPLRVRVHVDSATRSFTFEAAPPSTTWMLRRLLPGVKTFSTARGGAPCALVDARVLYEVARMRAQDPAMAHLPLRLVFRSVLATARSCNIDAFMPSA